MILIPISLCGLLLKKDGYHTIYAGKAHFGPFKAYGELPGLQPDTLEGPDDLPVWNNYRNILAPVLVRHGTADSLADIFPDFALSTLDLYR